jgi:predicted HTH domain antitoxin
MNLVLPDDILKGTHVTDEELRFDLALGLYIDEKVTLGQAARIAGISTPAFLDERGNRKIPIRYGVEDLAADEATLKTLEGREGS